MFLSVLRYGCLVAGALLFVVTPTRADEPQSVDLKSYLDEILRAHPEMKVADAEVAAAEARAQALGRPVYNPELGIDGDRAQTNAYSLSLSQTFDLSGKREARRASGSAEVAVARAARAAQRQRIATETLQALADRYGRIAALSLAKQRFEVLERFADLADQQYRAGDIGVLDRDLASLARTEAIALSGRAELDLLKAQQALDAVTRRPGYPPPPLPDQPPGVEHLRSDFDVLAAALPSVRTALARSEVLHAQIAVAQSQTRADPTIGLRGGHEADRGGGGNVGLVGLQLSIPLFLRNNFKAEVAAADAEASASRLDADAGYALAISTMQASAAQYRRTHDAWQRWTTLSAARIESSVELLDKVWRLREISTAEYLQQLRQLLDGRAAGAELRAQVWASWAEWLNASGEWQAWLDAPLDSQAAASAALITPTGN